MILNTKIVKLNSKKLENNIYYSSFNIFPLNSGQGITLGNSLRRTLLSDIIGTSITGIKINSFPKKGCLEDIFSICLNIKQIILKSNIIKKRKAYLKIKGPCIVTSSLINFTNDIINLNPNQYLFTLINNEEVNIEFYIENGKGVYLSDEHNKLNNDNIKFNLNSEFIPLDVFFGPVKRVNFSVNLVSSRINKNIILKENLFFEIYTNGSLSPFRSLKESLKILAKFYSNLLV